jgi:rubrerythrin
MAEMTLRKALEKAVATEAQGERYYKHMAETFADNLAVATVFEQLAADESEHEAQFKRLLDSVPADQGTGEDGEALLRAAFTIDSFDDKKMEDFADVKTPADALARALAFEKSTLFYYQSLKDVIGESAELDQLIAAEKQHVTSLMKVVISDAEFRGIADGW